MLSGGDGRQAGAQLVNSASAKGPNVVDEPGHSVVRPQFASVTVGSALWRNRAGKFSSREMLDTKSRQTTRHGRPRVVLTIRLP